TGMRISEIRGLRWRDVDLAVGTIHVRQRATLWGKIGPPKTRAGARDIPLVPMCVNALRAWRLACPKGELDLAFPNQIGGVRNHPHTRERLLMPLQKRAGVRAYGWHAYRHAFATLMIEQLHWSPKQLQVVMGHASVQMTYDRYGHLFANPGDDKEAL